MVEDHGPNSFVSKLGLHSKRTESSLGSVGWIGQWIFPLCEANHFPPPGGQEDVISTVFEGMGDAGIPIRKLSFHEREECCPVGRSIPSNLNSFICQLFGNFLHPLRSFDSFQTHSHSERFIGDLVAPSFEKLKCRLVAQIDTRSDVVRCVSVASNPAAPGRPKKSFPSTNQLRPDSLPTHRLIHKKRGNPPEIEVRIAHLFDMSSSNAEDQADDPAAKNRELSSFKVKVGIIQEKVLKALNRDLVVFQTPVPGLYDLWNVTNLQHSEGAFGHMSI